MGSLTGPFDTWIFDVDNTLYPASVGLFAQVQTRIQDLIGRLLDLPPQQARDLQRSLSRDYGTSLRGLMIHHNVDPVAFLAEVHSVDYALLSPDPRLADALGRLNGRKFLFTSGTAAHAEKILDRLGIRPALFDACIDIVSTDYLPKPAPQLYHQLLARHAIDPHRAIMVEDTPRNLIPALDLGLCGLLVDDGTADPHGEADFTAHLGRVETTPRLTDWLARFLGRPG